MYCSYFAPVLDVTFGVIHICIKNTAFKYRQGGWGTHQRERTSCLFAMLLGALCQGGTAHPWITGGCCSFRNHRIPRQFSLFERASRLPHCSHLKRIWCKTRFLLFSQTKLDCLCVLHFTLSTQTLKVRGFVCVPGSSEEGKHFIHAGDFVPSRLQGLPAALCVLPGRVPLLSWVSLRCSFRGQDQPSLVLQLFGH